MGYTFGYYTPPVADEEDVAYDPATGKPITNPASVSFPYYMTLPTNQSGNYPSSQPPAAQNTTTQAPPPPTDVVTGAPPDTADEPVPDTAPSPTTTSAPDDKEYGQGSGDPYPGNPFAYGTPAYWEYENASPIRQELMGMRMGEYLDYMDDLITSRWDKRGGGGSSGGSSGAGGGSQDSTNPPMMGYSALPGGEGMSPQPESYLPSGWQDEVNGMDPEEFDEWYAELSPMEKAEFDAYMAAYSQMWAEMYQ